MGDMYTGHMCGFQNTVYEKPLFTVFKKKLINKLKINKPKVSMLFSLPYFATSQKLGKITSRK